MIYPWQQNQFDRLMQAYQNGAMPHALLLTGLVGMGKVDFARHVAKILLCDQSLVEACGRCSSCQWYDAGSHPDLIELTLQDKSKVIKVDQVRQLTEKMQKTAQGSYRVALIFPADQMNSAASNALLKTLEEPPGRCLIVLSAAQPQRLTATIRSRCQQIDFSAVDRCLSLDWLREQGYVESAPLLLQHAYGAPLLVPHLHESHYLDCRDRVFDLMVKGLMQQQDLISGVPSLIKLDLNLLLRAMLSIVCDLLKISFGVGSGDIVNVDRVEAMQQVGSCLQAQPLMRFYSLLLQSKEEHDGGANLNVQLMLESLMLHWMNLKVSREVR